MPIFITTGGPIANVPSVLEPQIRTFADMINAISDDIDDTTNEYLSQIQEAIFSAIRFCEREPLYFNESREVSFLTIPGQEWYGVEQCADIATLGGLTAVYCETQNGNRRELRHEPPAVLETLSDSGAARGEPYCYTYFGQRLRLYPFPGEGPYKIRLQLSPVRLKSISSASEENPWFSEAFDLISARAKYEIYKNILKDAAMAAASFNDFNEQLGALYAETSRRNGTGKIRATGF